VENRKTAGEFSPPRAGAYVRWIASIPLTEGSRASIQARHGSKNQARSRIALGRPPRASHLKRAPVRNPEGSSCRSVRYSGHIDRWMLRHALMSSFDRLAGKRSGRCGGRKRTLLSRFGSMIPVAFWLTSGTHRDRPRFRFLIGGKSCLLSHRGTSTQRVY
jgi:hypothetical protein